MVVKYLIGLLGPDDDPSPTPHTTPHPTPPVCCLLWVPQHTPRGNITHPHTTMASLLCTLWDGVAAGLGHTTLALLTLWVAYRLAYRILYSGHASVFDSNGGCVGCGRRTSNVFGQQGAWW